MKRMESVDEKWVAICLTSQVGERKAWRERLVYKQGKYKASSEMELIAEKKW